MAAAYDFIVVGSGSAGGVIAARLSESGKYTVACLEAGTRGADYLWTRPPAAVAFLFDNPKVNWCWLAEPNPSLAGRQLSVPAGKLLGGTSSLNGMIYNRGQRHDYDRWAELGCTGWSYADVLPCFRRIENTAIGTDQYRGRDGPIHVAMAGRISPFYDLFTASAQAVGLPLNADYSGETQYGVSMAQMTIRNGERQSVATQYLAPARRRRNLTLIAGAEVASLILEGHRCVGVRFVRDGQMQEVRANREVILSAGTLGSPKLLELSGIGNPEILARYGISLVHALPGVGENLRDHYGPTMQWTFREKGISIADQGRGWKLAREVARYLLFRRGFVAEAWATMRVFTRSHEGVPQADIAILASPFLIEDRGKRRAMAAIDGFSLWAQVQRPESTGHAHIRSADWREQSAIAPDFLATENDRRTAIAGVRKAREIAAAPPLANVIDAERLPGRQVQTDDEILDFIRRTGSTTYHYAGTCKMGHDPMAVVDERLRVHGIAGLRVADASIAPTMISGNTSVPCMMIGEKCADMVIADATSSPG